MFKDWLLAEEISLEIALSFLFKEGKFLLDENLIDLEPTMKEILAATADPARTTDKRRLLNQLFEKALPYILAIVRNILKSNPYLRSSAEDIAQTVAMKLIRLIDSGKYKFEDGALANYVWKISHRVILDAIRKNSKRKTVSPDDEKFNLDNIQGRSIGGSTYIAPASHRAGDQDGLARPDDAEDEGKVKELSKITDILRELEASDDPSKKIQAYLLFHLANTTNREQMDLIKAAHKIVEEHPELKKDKHFYDFVYTIRLRKPKGPITTEVPINANSRKEADELFKQQPLLAKYDHKYEIIGVRENSFTFEQIRTWYRRGMDLVREKLVAYHSSPSLSSSIKFPFSS